MRTPPLSHWTIVLTVVLTEPMLLKPPSVTTATDWVLDTGIRGEAFAWRHHLIQAGIDPDQGRLTDLIPPRALSESKAARPRR